jgi:glycerol-3-phosphate dehydrogenase (NAD(P)+)
MAQQHNMTPAPIKQQIAVLGAGAWGSALALHLARQNQQVCLWSNDSEQVSKMRAERVNTRYLAGYILPANITPMADLATALQLASNVVIAVPSTAYREILIKIKPCLQHGQGFLAATKGMDSNRNFLHQSFTTIIGDNHPFGILSGPSFAQEVAACLPTAVVIASKNQQFSAVMRSILQNSTLHIDLSTDVLGVAIAGIIKNVLAIATGILDGMQLGANARSTLITQGFNELLKLTTALGGETTTCHSVAGIGDLILSCTSDLSRNRRFGLALGQGQTIATAQQTIGCAIEGLNNALLIHNLAIQLTLDLPICAAVAAIIDGKIDTTTAISNIFT